MLWKIVLMALLVNFSFPITRFIIDASNILMYSIINSSLFTDSAATTALVKITGDSELGKMLTSTNFPTSATLIAATIMVLMLAISFLAIGVLLLVRVIVLAILIIFSPIAFAGSIIPGLTSHASKWWEALLKYSLFGPTIILGVAITIKFMNGVGKSLGGNALNVAANQVSQDANFVGYIAFLLLPIVLLWTVLSVAQKMGIAGSSAIMGAAQNAMKWSAAAPLKAIKKGASTSGLTGGVKQAWNKKVTQPLDRGKQKREAYFAGKFGDETAAERNMKTRASEYEKNNESESDLKKWAAGGDAAAAYSLANKGKIDPATFNASMNAIKDKKAKESLMKKTSESRMDVTLGYKLKENQAKASAGDSEAKARGWNNIYDVAKDSYGDLTAEEWAKQKDLDKQFKSDLILHIEARNAFKKLHKTAQIEALKRMTGTNANAIA